MAAPPTAFNGSPPRRVRTMSEAALALGRQATGIEQQFHPAFERLPDESELVGPLPQMSLPLPAPMLRLGSTLYEERRMARAHIIKASPVLYHTESWLETLLTPSEYLPPRIFYFVVALVSLVTWGAVEYPDIHTSADDRLHNTMIGFISLLIVFRTSQAYARWWEGRTLWGAIVNSTRNLASNAATFIGDEARYTHTILCTIAFAYATKQSLRGKKLESAEMRGLFSDEEVALVNQVEHIPLLMIDEIRRTLRVRRTAARGSAAPARAALRSDSPCAPVPCARAGVCRRSSSTSRRAAASWPPPSTGTSSSQTTSLRSSTRSAAASGSPRRLCPSDTSRSCASSCERSVIGTGSRAPWRRRADGSRARAPRAAAPRASLLWLVSWPFALTAEYGWASIPLVSIVAFIMLKIDEMAVQIEHPFGVCANDLPIDTICVTIERNLLEILRRAEHARLRESGGLAAGAEQPHVLGAEYGGPKEGEPPVLPEAPLFRLVPPRAQQSTSRDYMPPPRPSEAAAQGTPNGRGWSRAPAADSWRSIV